MLLKKYIVITILFCHLFSPYLLNINNIGIKDNNKENSDIYQDIDTLVPVICLYYNMIEYEELIQNLIHTESRGKHDAVSHKDAMGLMQIRQGALTDFNNEFGTSIKIAALTNSKLTNIIVGMWYLKEKCIKRHKDIDKALSAYNAGPNHKGFMHKYVSNVREGL